MRIVPKKDSRHWREQGEIEMFPGHCTLCIPTTDLKGSQAFYEAMGMVTTNAHDQGVSLSNGDLHIFLMGFQSQLSFNFRGADPFAFYDLVAAAGIEPDGKPMSYKKEQFNATADGGNWMTHDPDGTAIFFDTNEFDLSEQGNKQVLCRILDGARNQLINLGADDEVMKAYDDRIMQHHVTDDMRKEGRAPKFPDTVQGKFAGHFTWCIKSEDTEKSRKFYEAMGLETGEPSEGGHIHMSTSCCDIDLMNFLPGNCFNFRGADVFRVYEQMAAAGLELEGEPVGYTKEEFGQPGGHWQTKDPEGNVVYFDTTDPELIEPGDPTRIKNVLERACRQIADTGVNPAASEAIARVLS